MVVDMLKGASYGYRSRFKILSLTDTVATITAYANVPFIDGLQFIGEVKHVRQERPGQSAVTDNSFNLRLIWIW